MVFYLIFLSLYTSLVATPNDYIRIQYLDDRPLFYSKHTGYFWSIGVNTFMDAGNNDPLKKLLKTKKEELKDKYEDFYRNLYEQQLKLIQDHGFNALYTWSNLKFLDNKLPFGVVLFDDGVYTVKTPLLNFEGALPPKGDGEEACSIGDPYDEEYQKALDVYIKGAVSPYKQNIQLLVYWLGAEFGLGDSEATDFSAYVYSKGVQAHLTKWFEKKYNKITILNKKWDTRFNSFKEAAATKAIASTKYHQDLTEFSVEMLRDWFKLVLRTIRKYDPHHLCLLYTSPSPRDS